jgi:hypothetical protein
MTSQTGRCANGAKEHEWQPLSFVFESQVLDPEGRVHIRQPDTDNARVYCVCMKCYTHTYITTEWIGHFIPGPHDPQHPDHREEWRA